MFGFLLWQSHFFFIYSFIFPGWALSVQINRSVSSQWWSGEIGEKQRLESGRRARRLASDAWKQTDGGGKNRGGRDGSKSVSVCVWFKQYPIIHAQLLPLSPAYRILRELERCLFHCLMKWKWEDDGLPGNRCSVDSDVRFWASSLRCLWTYILLLVLHLTFLKHFSYWIIYLMKLFTVFWFWSYCYTFSLLLCMLAHCPDLKVRKQSDHIWGTCF